MNLRAVAKRKFKVTTDSEHSKPIYENVLNRDFSTTTINQKWCGDITYVRTMEGWMYLAVIIDLHSRAVIGWSMDKTMKQDLVCNALLMALYRRKFPVGVIIHSDILFTGRYKFNKSDAGIDVQEMARMLEKALRASFWWVG